IHPTVHGRVGSGLIGRGHTGSGYTGYRLHGNETIWVSVAEEVNNSGVQHSVGIQQTLRGSFAMAMRIIPLYRKLNHPVSVREDKFPSSVIPADGFALKHCLHPPGIWQCMAVKMIVGRMSFYINKMSHPASDGINNVPQFIMELLNCRH